MTERILVADDQVPDSSLTSEQKVLEFYRNKYNDAAFAQGFVFLYKFIKTLKSRGYKVDATNTYTEIQGYLKSNVYNVIILDLGWYTIDDMPYDDKMILGWDLADEIRKKTSTPIVMFSNRFYEDNGLARTAADKSLLPFYKSYDDECLKQIVVTIRFLATSKPLKELLTEDQKLHSFNMYRRLSTILIYALVGTFTLLLFSIILSLKDFKVASILSTVFGVATSFINYTIYKYIRAYRSDIF